MGTQSMIRSTWMVLTVGLLAAVAMLGCAKEEDQDASAVSPSSLTPASSRSIAIPPTPRLTPTAPFVAVPSGRARATPIPTPQPTTIPGPQPMTTPTPQPTTIPVPQPTAVSAVADTPSTGFGFSPCSYYWEDDTGRPIHWGFLQWTPDGSRLVFGDSQVIWTVDSSGQALDRVFDTVPGSIPSGNYYLPMAALHADVSADGSRILFPTCEIITRRTWGGSKIHSHEIATVAIDGTGRQNVTENKQTEFYPVWSPDETRIAFVTNWNKYPEDAYTLAEELRLYILSDEGSTVSSTMDSPVGGVALAPPVWSPDGKYIAFLVNEDTFLPDYQVIYTVQADGTGMKRIGETPFVLPAWSPKGEELAFVGRDMGLYAIQPDGSGLRELTDKYRWPSAHWIHQLAWAPDGSELLIVHSSGLEIVDVDSNSSLLLDVAGEGSIQKVDYNSSFESKPARAAWSPDGSQIAVFYPCYRHYTHMACPATRLLTIDRDGTNLQVLVSRENTDS